MTDAKRVSFALDKILQAGADKAQCVLNRDKRYELIVENNEITMFRTTFNTNLGYKAIKDRRQATLNSNKSDEESIACDAVELVGLAAVAQEDPAYDIAPMQESKTFEYGEERPDQELMHRRMTDFLSQARAKFPKTTIESAYLNFINHNSTLQNSNGVDFHSRIAYYSFTCLFNSSENEKVSSMNYSSVDLPDLSADLLTTGSVETLLEQSAQQIETKSISEKFVGDLIISPDCMQEFIHCLLSFIGDFAMISGNSIYKGKLNTQIANPGFTLSANPLSADIVDKEFVTSDGFEAKDFKIVDKGILKNYLLGLYGANKTGLDRSPNDGAGLILEPGEVDYKDMIKSVDKGILLCRFSGGGPSFNGDIAGIAKNSYYIEDGEIKYPVGETMISGNIAKMLLDIPAISRERINFGDSIFPWMRVSGFTVSGK